MNFVYGHVGEIVTDTKRLREIAKNVKLEIVCT